MSREALEYTQFETRLREALQTDVMTADRVDNVITDEIPPRLYGKLLLCFSAISSETSAGSNPIDAAIAIEFAFLHQYLHMISRIDADVSDSIEASVYPEDTDAAILDGDLLQSCAFTRLSGAAEAPKTTHRCYEILARASVECYERLHEDSTAAVTTPLLGAAAQIGSIIGGVDRTAAREIDQLTRSIAEAIPVKVPRTQNVDPNSVPSVSTVNSTIEELDTIISSSVSTTRSLEPLLKDTVLHRTVQ